ncbi:MAG: D-aminoacylase [Nitrospirae bacterium]|nr:D-aminoacylase [Nitrospirota bacterium]MCL5978797.1 D-aminoacylase [Nitrospirota bacterium]
MLDCFIKNGLVYNGSGSGPVETNIGIKDERIAYIGNDEVPAGTVIDAKGLVVSPGFIDTHAHSEFTILADGRAEGKLSQGVTTEINGNCGLSAAPLCGDAFEHREADLKELGIKERWSSFGQYFDILKHKGIAINFATLCGHGNIRASVIGYRDIQPDENAMNEMKRHLSDAVEQGAKGISTGLIYPPGVYSETGELMELSGILSPDGIYASHMRSEGDALIESIEEVIAISKGTDVKVHISHIKTAGERNWWKADKAIELIEDARNSGVNVTCDRYPYIAASTDLDTVLPSWVYDGGVEEELRRLKDKAAAEKIKEEIGSKNEDYWKGIFVSSVAQEKNKWMEGENIFDIALKLSKKPIDALFEIIIDEKARAGAIFFSMSEGNLRKFLSLPYAMIGSDSSVRSFSGITRSGKPHPRGFGTFPRFIGKYVRDEGLMPLSEAIRKMTSLPAETFGLKERGFIREGFHADIVIFDYEKIIDNAVFKEPFKMASGINYVFVNGSLAFRNGEFTGSRSGRVLM